MLPAVVSGIVARNLPVRLLAIFTQSPVTVPEVFSNVYSAPFPSSLLKWLMDHLRKARYRSLSRRTAVTKKSHSVCRVRYRKLG